MGTYKESGSKKWLEFGVYMHLTKSRGLGFQETINIERYMWQLMEHTVCFTKVCLCIQH